MCPYRDPPHHTYQYQYYYRTDIPMELQENIHRIHEAIRKNRGRGKHYPTHFRIDLMTEIQEYKQKREGDEQREF